MSNAPCSLQVLMVLWEVLAAHHCMRSWLAGQLRAADRHAAVLDQVRRSHALCQMVSPAVCVTRGSGM